MSEGQHNHIKYRCSGCGKALGVYVPDAASVIAKHECPICNTVNEVKTRETFEDMIEDHVAEGKEINRHNDRAPVSVNMGGVDFGPAYLIDP